jgi:hypothetical protein
VARIEGIEFVVVLAGYHSVPFSNGPSIDGVTDRITAVLFPARFSLPSAIYVSRPPSFALHLPTGGTLESRYARLGWVEIPRPVWVATGVTCRAVERPLLVKRNAGIPMRTATDSEGRVAEFWHGRRARSGGASWLSWREVRIVLWDADQGGALAFSLTPDQEHHLKRYLAEED